MTEFTKLTPSYQGGEFAKPEHVIEVQEAFAPIESELADHEARVTAAETVNTSQGLRLDLVQYLSRTMAALGDSISPTYTINWPAWGCIQSGGQLFFTKAYSTGGYTTAQILATHVPEVVAATPKPGYCAVLAGRNDITANDFSGWTVTYTAIIDALLAAGIMPILCSLCPANSMSTANATWLAKANYWLGKTARQRGLLFVDWTSVLTDPATNGAWLSGYDSDGTHPTTATQALMGLTFGTAVQNFFKGKPTWTPPLAVSNTDPTNLITNGLFLTDSNTDGTADNWTVFNGTSPQVTRTIENPSGADVVGKWQRINGNDTNPQAAYLLLRSASISVTPGDRMSVAFRIKAAVEAGSPVGKVYNCGLMNPSGGQSAATLGNTEIAFAGSHLIQKDFGPLTIYRECVIASGVTTAAFQFGLDGYEGYVQVGQVTVRNLTALGLA